MITTNWNNIKNKLEHNKFIKSKYKNKKVLNNNFKGNSIKFFTTDVEPSPAEAKLVLALTSLKIKYFREVSFKDFKTPNGGHYRFDFYIPSKNIIIEYDGKDWHTNSESDKIKNKFCKINNIKLIRLDSTHYYQFKKVLKLVLN